MVAMSALRLLILLFVATAVLAEASVNADDLTRGFSRRAPAAASGEERNRQTDLRVMEVQFKPMRMVYVDVTDPRTGKTTEQEVWYLVYRSITRPTAGRVDDTDTKPVNVIDAQLRPIMFIPEFELKVYEGPDDEIPASTHFDQILPEAVNAIRKKEERGGSFTLKNSVDIVQTFPEATPTDAPPEDQKWVYGIATWTGIDKATDFFDVTARGFSNAFEEKLGPDGEPLPWRKTITLKFESPGDEFDRNGGEFRFKADPAWGYQPDSPAVQKAVEPVVTPPPGAAPRLRAIGTDDGEAAS